MSSAIAVGDWKPNLCGLNRCVPCHCGPIGPHPIAAGPIGYGAWAIQAAMATARAKARFAERWHEDAYIWAGSNERGRISIDWKRGKSYFAIMVQEAGKPMQSTWVSKGSADHSRLAHILPPFGAAA